MLVAAALLACSEPAPVNLPPRPALDELARWHREMRDVISEGEILEVSSYLQRSFCPLHGDVLFPDVVRIEYGLLNFDGDYLRALEGRFPFAVTVFGGGCMPDPATHARVKYCPRCRLAKQAWMEEHPHIRELGDRAPAAP